MEHCLPFPTAVIEALQAPFDKNTDAFASGILELRINSLPGVSFFTFSLYTAEILATHSAVVVSFHS